MKNIAEILRAYFKANEPIYSPVCGEVTDWYVRADGDIVMKKCDTTYTFDEYGRMDEFGDCLVFSSKNTRSWEDFEYKRQFKPFDKVVVRTSDEVTKHWHCSVFSHLNENSEWPYIMITGFCYKHCLPYNEMTAKLVGTTDELSGC